MKLSQYRLHILTPLLVALFFISWLGNSQAFASGLTTSSDTKNNQVITRNEDGVIYLSTQVATTAGSTSSAAQNQSSQTSFLSLFDGTFSPPQGFADNISQLINALLSIVMVFAALLVLFNLIVGAFQWITSGGDKGKIDQARNRMISAVVGIIIVASTYAMLLLVLNFLGFENLNDVFQNTVNLNTTIDPNEIRTATTSASPNASPTPASDLGELL